MATWVRNLVGALSASGADLTVGDSGFSLDNGTAPADFDPSNIQSVRVEGQVEGSGFSDDSWDLTRGWRLTLAGDGAALALDSASTLTGLGNTTQPIDATDSTVDNTRSVADWESAQLFPGTISGTRTLGFYDQNMSNDGGTIRIPLSVPRIRLTITYTPLSAATVEESDYRVYAEGTESASVALAETNRGAVVEYDTPFQVRFLVKAGGAGSVSLLPKLQTRHILKGSGSAVDWSAWEDVGPSSNRAIPAASVNLTDNGATTQRLGVGTFVAGKIDEADGTFDAAINLDAGQETELVFSLQLVGADAVTEQENIQFRLVNASDGALYDTYRYPPSSVNSPLLWEHGFEGGTDGAPVNTTLADPDSFDAILDADSQITYSNLHPAHGSIAGRFNRVDGAATTRFRFWDLNQGAVVFLRFYLYPDALVSSGAAVRIVGWTGGYEAGDIQSAVLEVDTSHRLRIQDADGVVGTMTGSLSADTMYRIEMSVRAETADAAGDGSIEVRLYAGDNTTPIETLGPVSATTQTEIEDVDIGPFQETLDYHFDDIAIGNEDWIGPFSAGNNFDETGRQVTINSTVTSTDQASLVNNQFVSATATVESTEALSGVESRSVAASSNVGTTDSLSMAEGTSVAVASDVQSLSVQSMAEAASLSIQSTVSGTDFQAMVESAVVTIASDTTSTDNLSSGATNYDETGRQVNIASTVQSSDDLAMTEILSVDFTSVVILADDLSMSEAPAVVVSSEVSESDVGAFVDSPLLSIASTISSIDDFTGATGTEYNETGRLVAGVVSIEVTDSVSSVDEASIVIASSLASEDRLLMSEGLSSNLLATILANDVAEFIDNLTVTVFATVSIVDDFTGAAGTQYNETGRMVSGNISIDTTDELASFDNGSIVVTSTAGSVDSRHGQELLAVLASSDTFASELLGMQEQAQLAISSSTQSSGVLQSVEEAIVEGLATTSAEDVGFFLDDLLVVVTATITISEDIETVFSQTRLSFKSIIDRPGGTSAPNTSWKDKI